MNTYENFIIDRFYIHLDKNVDLECIEYSSIDSTQLHARRNKEFIKLSRWKLWISDSQTHGIGQRENNWFSPKNSNIYATFGIKLKKTQSFQISYIPYIAALSILEMLNKYNISGKLKWPNDILFSKKKAGGVLVEAFTNIKDVTLLIGIGININMPKFMAKQVNNNITSILIETGRKYERKILIKELSLILFTNLLILEKIGFSHFIDSINNVLETFNGSPILFNTFENPARYLNCRIYKIDNNGELILFDFDQNKFLNFHKGKILV